MVSRKRAPQPETSAPPQDVSAAGPAPVPAEPVEEAAAPPASLPVAPPHPVRRYRISPAAHIGTRVGGFVLTERGWVRDDTSSEQE